MKRSGSACSRERAIRRTRIARNTTAEATAKPHPEKRVCLYYRPSHPTLSLPMKFQNRPSSSEVGLGNEKAEPSERLAALGESILNPPEGNVITGKYEGRNPGQDRE
jgi:hypothetical protein